MKKKYFRNVKDHPDFFIIDISELSIKNDMLTMQYPFFSLSKKKDIQSREFPLSDGTTVKVSCNASYGLATIHDKDVWLYFLSLAVLEFNETGEVPEEIHFHSYDCLKTIKRGTGGNSYARLRDIIRRLAGTVIETNAETIKKSKFEIYPLIGQTAFVENKKDNVVAGYVSIPKWIREHIKTKKIKTINPDYFLLKRGLDKRLYEIASKHVGHGTSWGFSLDELQKKCGSLSTRFEFRRMIKESEKNLEFPDYYIEFDQENDFVKFINRNPTKVKIRNHTNRDDLPIVSEQAKDKVRKLALKSDNTKLSILDDVAYSSYVKWVEFWKLTGRKNINDVDKDYLIFSANFVKEFDGV